MNNNANKNIARCDPKRRTLGIIVLQFFDPKVTRGRSVGSLINHSATPAERHMLDGSDLYIYWLNQVKSITLQTCTRTFCR